MIDLLEPSVAALIGAALGTYACRLAGVLAGQRLDLSAPAFVWVSCVAYATLAALISRMILLPNPPLAYAPLGLRLGAVGIGLAVFVLSGRRVAFGVFATCGALAGLAWAWGISVPSA